MARGHKRPSTARIQRRLAAKANLKSKVVKFRGLKVVKGA